MKAPTGYDTFALEAGVKLLAGEPVDFLDPWANRIEFVEYKGVQFTKSAEILSKITLWPRDKEDNWGHHGDLLPADAGRRNTEFRRLELAGT